MSADDANLDRLIGTLLAQHDSVQRQLLRIEAHLERLSSNHDTILGRVIALELVNAQNLGSKKTMVALGGAAATVGGLIVSLVTKMWPLWN